MMRLDETFRTARLGTAQLGIGMIRLIRLACIKHAHALASSFYAMLQEYARLMTIAFIH